MENKDFFDYCRNVLHKDFFIVPEHNNVKIKEFKETKLEEVRVYFEVDTTGNNNHIIEFFVNGKKYKKTKNRINDILKLILFKDL